MVTPGNQKAYLSLKQKKRKLSHCEGLETRSMELTQCGLSRLRLPVLVLLCQLNEYMQARVLDVHQRPQSHQKEDDIGRHRNESNSMGYGQLSAHPAHTVNPAWIPITCTALFKVAYNYNSKGAVTSSLFSSIFTSTNSNTDTYIHTVN